MIPNIIRQRWEMLSPSMRRGTVVATAFSLLIFMLSIFVNEGGVDTRSSTQQQSSQPIVGTLLSPQNFKGINQDRMVADLIKLKENNAKLTNTVANLQNHLTSKINDLKTQQMQSINDVRGEAPNVQALVQDAVEAELSRRENLSALFPRASSKTKITHPVTAIPSIKKAQNSVEPDLLEDSSNQTILKRNMSNPFVKRSIISRNMPMPSSSHATSQQQHDVKKVLPPPALSMRTIRDDYAARQLEINNTTTGGADTPDPKLFIPAGSLISGRLVTGMDAGTGQDARKNPYPSLLRIKGDAILPNFNTADLKECFVLASGYGELSSERVYIRSEKLSCIRVDGGVIEIPINMFAVGEDGKAGVRGRLVSKQGSILAKAMVAGFAEGVASAFGQNQVSTISTAATGAVPYQNRLSQRALKGGLSQGASSALDRLAQYYIDMADQMFPILEVDAGRKIEFVLESGISIKAQSINGE